MTVSGSAPALLVVDSSIAVKWFKSANETCLEESWGLLDAHRTGALALVVPGHMPAEVLNGLRYARLGTDLVREAAMLLDDLDLVVVPLTRHLTEPAVAIASAEGLTVNDALFTALAARLSCPLVTADRKQAATSACEVRLLR